MHKTIEIFVGRAALRTEILALRQQVAVLKRKRPRPSLRMADRVFWVILSYLWPDWRHSLVIVKPETVIAWHREGFRLFWTWKSRRGKPGRPPVSREIRDRDGVYGFEFRDRVVSMGIEEVVTAPRSPWQIPYVERVIGTIRRECLDHVIILNERHSRRILGSYLDYYHGSRTHLSLGKDTPDGRPVQPASSGKVVSLPQLGGLHHRYERLAA